MVIKVAEELSLLMVRNLGFTRFIATTIHQAPPILSANS
jgi:hypothetical protein